MSNCNLLLNVILLLSLFLISQQSKPKNGPVLRPSGGLPPNLFPYNVAIIRNGNIYDNCGGALIRNHTVITAATCIPKGSKIEIILGAFDLFMPNMNQIRILVRRSQINFDNGGYLALIKLNPALNISGIADEIRLAEEEDDLYVGDTAILTSWDDTTRMSAKVTRKISPHDCSSMLQDVGINLLDGEMCAVVETKAPWSGRGIHVRMGSPLVNPRTKKLIGIVSNNPWILREYPIKFFRITNFIVWINSIIAPNNSTYSKYMSKEVTSKIYV